MARNVGFSNETQVEIAMRYMDGESAVKLARSVGVDHSTIYDILKRQNIPRRNRSDAHRLCELNQSAFDTLTPDAAYWIGFLFADGTITTHKNSRYIGIVISDADRSHVEKFKAFVGSTHKLRIVERRPTPGGRKGSRPTARLSFASTHMAERLEYLGMTNSTVADRVASPELVSSPDFWRGMIDGDGSIGLKTGNRGLIMLCGNRTLIEQWLSFVKKHCPDSGAAPRHDKSIFQTSISGHDARVMLTILYDNNRVALDRKKEQAMRILDMPEPRRYQRS